MRTAWIALICINTWFPACADEVIASDITEIGRGYGYLLLDLNLERDVGHIKLHTNTKIKSKSKNRRDRGTIELGPFKAGRHLRLIALPQGEYQWEETNVHHYDLPSYFSTVDDDRWQFSIKALRINYIGQLLVSEERSSRSVAVRLVNRIATSGEEVREKFATEIERYPLNNSGSFRDHFFETWVNRAEEGE